VPGHAGDKVYPVRIVALHQKNNTVKLEADVYDVILEQPVPTRNSSKAGSAEGQQAATISIADLLRNVKDAGGKNYIDPNIYFQTTAGNRANIDRVTRDRVLSAYPDLSQIDTEITINHSKMPYEYSEFEPGETLGNTAIPPKFIISASNPVAAKRAAEGSAECNIGKRRLRKQTGRRYRN